MIQRILVPTDLGDKSGPTLITAANLAGKYDSAVTLLHVIETVEHIPFEDLKDFYLKLETKAKSALASLERDLKKQQIQTECAIVYGKRLEQIIAYARTDKTDLILLGSHVLDVNSEKPRLGSLSHGIAILAPCSVFLARLT